MLTEYVRTEGYEPAFDSEVDPTARRFHLMVAPFGSTGYYRSATGAHLDEGFGVAFNNLTDPRGPLRLPEGAEIVLEIERGQARGALKLCAHRAALPRGGWRTECCGPAVPIQLLQERRHC